MDLVIPHLPFKVLSFELSLFEAGVDRLASSAMDQSEAGPSQPRGWQHEDPEALIDDQDPQYVTAAELNRSRGVLNVQKI